MDCGLFHVYPDQLPKNLRDISCVGMARNHIGCRQWCTAMIWSTTSHLSAMNVWHSANVKLQRAFRYWIGVKILRAKRCRWFARGMQFSVVSFPVSPTTFPNSRNCLEEIEMCMYRRKVWTSWRMVYTWYFPNKNQYFKEGAPPAKVCIVKGTWWFQISPEIRSVVTYPRGILIEHGLFFLCTPWRNR